MAELHAILNRAHIEQGLVMFYNKLTAEQIISVYHLLNFLERLRITGHLKARTVKSIDLEPIDPFMEDVMPIIDMSDANYAIEKESYDPKKGRIRIHEELEKMFGRLGKRLRGTD